MQTQINILYWNASGSLYKKTQTNKCSEIKSQIRGSLINIKLNINIFGYFKIAVNIFYFTMDGCSEGSYNSMNVYAQSFKLQLLSIFYILPWTAKMKGVKFDSNIFRFYNGRLKWGEFHLFPYSSILTWTAKTRGVTFFRRFYHGRLLRMTVLDGTC